jgi:hypothetical protein
VSQPQKLIHRQEKEKLFLKQHERDRLSLHSKMMFEAVDIVKHYWTDVTVHDRKRLNQMPAHSTAIWGIHEMGSYFSPLFADLPKNNEACLADMPSIAYLLCRGKNKLINQQESIADSWKFFFLMKGSSSFHGSIEPIDYDSLFKFVFSTQKSDSIND